MRFNSVIYLSFLAVVVAALWLLPYRVRRYWLLGASYVFYGSWHWPFLSLILGTGLLNTYGARWIAAGQDRKARARWIIAANLLLLGAFKYLGWLVDNANMLASWVGLEALEPPKWVLPLGISFYVFEGLSYIVDVARKREKPYAFWDFQLYIAFFPHLIAGPILRVREFFPQLRDKLGFDASKVSSGLWALATGLAMKVVLADGISSQVDSAFARDAGSLGAVDVAVMAAAFGLQIYFDFAGYSRIALGSARLCGVELVENFDHPYAARSVVEFWARWHMSLSRWIRDYVFYPLTGGKTTWPALARAAVLSMTLCGLWHGAGWTFVLWGLYHGVLIAGHHLVRTHFWAQKRPNHSPTMLQRLGSTASLVLTFGLVSAGWILFRAENLQQAGTLLAVLCQPWSHHQRALSGTFYLHTFVLVLATWLAPWAFGGLARLEQQLEGRERRGPGLAWASLRGLAVGGLLALAFIYLRGQTAFIYFQF